MREREREGEMEWRRGIGSPAAALAVACAVLAMIPEVSSVRYTVGGSSGWSSKANLTVWAQSIHFYNGDWLCKPTLSLSLVSDLLL